MDETLAATPEAGVTRTFLDQGVLGAVVLVLCFAIYKLWQKTNELQERCVTLALKSTEAVEVVTASLERNTDAIERLERIRERD